MTGQFSFKPKSRLRTAKDYNNTFQQTKFRVSNNNLLMLACPNELEYSRVGIIVSKKKARLAVQRNRIKRIVRESFRQNQHSLNCVDIVVLAKAGIAELSSQECRQAVEQLWGQLNNKINRYMRNSDAS